MTIDVQTHVYERLSARNAFLISTTHARDMRVINLDEDHACTRVRIVTPACVDRRHHVPASRTHADVREPETLVRDHFCTFVVQVVDVDVRVRDGYASCVHVSIMPVCTCVCQRFVMGL